GMAAASSAVTDPRSRRPRSLPCGRVSQGRRRSPGRASDGRTNSPATHPDPPVPRWTPPDLPAGSADDSAGSPGDPAESPDDAAGSPRDPAGPPPERPGRGAVIPVPAG